MIWNEISLSQVGINELATLLQNNEHRGIGGDGTQQAWGETTPEPSPATFITIQLNSAVDDASELALRVFQLIWLKWWLDDVSGVRKRPVGHSSHSTTDEQTWHWQVFHSPTQWWEAISTQLIETCNTGPVKLTINDSMLYETVHFWDGNLKKPMSSILCRWSGKLFQAVGCQSSQLCVKT